jgi:hypothetical protein
MTMQKKLQRLEELMRSIDMACMRANHEIASIEREIRDISDWVSWAKDLIKELEESKDCGCENTFEPRAIANNINMLKCMKTAKATEVPGQTSQTSQVNREVHAQADKGLSY